MPNNYKLCKVFDCQNMPDDIKQYFMDLCSENCRSNDSYVDWYFEEDDELLPEYQQVQAWLLSNGAEFKDESVIIKYWW